MSNNVNINISEQNNENTQENNVEENEINKKIEEWFKQLEQDKKELEALTKNTNNYINRSNTDTAIAYRTTNIEQVAMSNISRLQALKRNNQRKNRNTSIIKPTIYSKNRGVVKPFQMKLF